MKIRRALEKNSFFAFTYDKFKEFYFRNFFTDESFIKKRFKNRLGRDVDLLNPIKYNDKLQWLKLNWYDSLAIKCADKYAVRTFVQECIGSQYLNDLLGVYESVDEINLDKLPKSFVLKGTHGSGFNIICEDKNKKDWKAEYTKMKRWLRNNYYWRNREWVYKDITPRIICEKFLKDENGKPPMDYKIFCFHGEPRLIQVDVDRFGYHKSNFYNTDWEYQDIEIKNPSDKSIQIQRPNTLNEMLMLSKNLSSYFPHVRVDFYEVKGKVIFGELTFFHHSGMGEFRPEKFEEEMGSYLHIPI